MSAIANITVFDGQTTPVSHTFWAESVTREKGSVTASYKEEVVGVPDYAQGRITVKKTKLGSGVTKTSVRVELPVMEAIAGQNSAGYTAAPKVAYIDTVEINGFFSDRSQILGRRSVRGLATNLANSVATSVTQTVTGPVPELMDLLINPT